MPRIEFGFFDAGGGHRAAATALEMAIEAQQRPWEVQLTNLQELLDPLDIRQEILQDPNSRRLQHHAAHGLDIGQPAADAGSATDGSALSPADGSAAGGTLERNQPDMVVSFVPHFNRAMGESFRLRVSGAPFRHNSHRHRRLSAAFLDRAAEAIFDLRFGSRRRAGARDGASGRSNLPRLGNDFASAVLRRAGGRPRRGRACAWDCGPRFRRAWFCSEATARRSCWKSPSAWTGRIWTCS